MARVDRMKKSDRNAVVRLDGEIVQDVLWADDVTGEVCIFQRGLRDRLALGNPRDIKKILTGTVEISWPI